VERREDWFGRARSSGNCGEGDALKKRLLSPLSCGNEGIGVPEEERRKEVRDDGGSIAMGSKGLEETDHSGRRASRGSLVLRKG